MNTPSGFSVEALQARLALYKAAGQRLPLSRAEVAQVIKGFLSGAVQKDEVAAWAEFLDGNEDVEFEPKASLPDVIFELSSPEINGWLEPERAMELLNLLENM